MNFRTKPRGEQLSFITSCWKCAGDMTISNGRPDPHTCREPNPITLDQIRFALGNRSN